MACIKRSDLPKVFSKYGCLTLYPQDSSNGSSRPTRLCLTADELDILADAIEASARADQATGTYEKLEDADRKERFAAHYHRLADKARFPNKYLSAAAKKAMGWK